MEDIIGFEDQIGAKFFNVLKRAVKNPIQAATMKAKTNIAKAKAQTSLVNRITQQRNIMVANRIAKGLPIPANIKNALVKNANAGKPMPNIIKRGLEIAKQKGITPQAPQGGLIRAMQLAKQKAITPQAKPTGFGFFQRAANIAKQKKVVPIALPKKTNLTTSQLMQRAVNIAKQKAITPQAPQGGLIRAMQLAKQKAIPVNQLTRVTNRNQVNIATPIQKSFMPVDLPFVNFAPKTQALKIPATNYSLPTNIDLVEPAVDAGTANYYGK